MSRRLQALGAEWDRYASTWVREHWAEVTVRHLPEPVSWGREIDDDRCLVLGRA